MVRRDFILAKAGDLALVTFYYFVFALAASVLLNLLTRIYERYTTRGDTKQKSTIRLVFEIVANIFFIAVTFWGIRNAVEAIPYPLDGMGGYQHARLQQTTTSAIAALTLILFQTTLTDKIRELNARIFTKTTEGAKGGGSTLTDSLLAFLQIQV